jgi:hypothetical protein
VTDAKITAYREAVEELTAATKALRLNPPDWKAAFDRVHELAHVCAMRRRALGERVGIG